jgi:DNA-binding MarR family transcriptional regulator
VRALGAGCARPEGVAGDEGESERMGDDVALDTAAAMRVAALRETLRAFLRESELIAQANGLTPQRHLLLLMIKGAPDGSECSTVTDLAARLRLAQTTVTDLVARAERAGLVERERAPHDARVAVLRLTAEGQRRLAASVHGHASERERLREMLRALETGEPR